MNETVITADKLTKKFGARGFDYAGNSSVDLDVWKGSRKAVVVNASNTLPARAREKTSRPRPFGPHERVRPHAQLLQA